jgi:hypothetical protein
MDHSLMICKLRRCRRLSCFLEVGGCAEHQSTRLSDHARHNRRVGEHAHAKSHIDAFLDQVAVVENRFDGELGMRCQE